MSFSFSPDLDDAVSRVRYGVGDTQAPGLQADETYEALLVDASHDEPAAIRAAAAGLAARYATEPDSISDDGTTIRWGERVSHWRLIALGNAGSTRAVSKGPCVGRITAGADYRVR